MRSTSRHALSGRSGRGQPGEADERCDADGDGADDGEDHLPGCRGHGHLRDYVRGAIAGDSRGRDEEQDEQKPEPGPGDDAECELADPECRPAGHEADGDPAERPRPGMEGQMPTVKPTKNGSAKTASVNSNQQKKPMPRSTSSGPRIIMMVVSVRSSSNGRAFHHHHGADESVTEGAVAGTGNHAEPSTCQRGELISRGYRIIRSTPEAAIARGLGAS